MLTRDLKIYPQVLKNVRVTDKKTARENPAVCEAVRRAEEALGDDGRVLVRESGTEPVLRVMAEAGTFEACEENVDAIIEAMKTSGHLIEVKK